MSTFIVRALNGEHDWLAGKGLEDYLSGLDAVAQSIDTRLSSFLGDCFFATNVGIDWFNLVGPNVEQNLNVAISTTILNTQNVSGLLQLSISLNAERDFVVTYSVSTNFGQITSSLTVPIATGYLTTQSGDPLITQDGDNIII